MTTHSGKLEKLANLGVALALGLVLITSLTAWSKHRLLHARVIGVGQGLPAGMITLPQTVRTFIIALQRGCKYCELSAPAFRSLIDGVSEDRSSPVVAVLPLGTQHPEEYVASLGLHVPVKLVDFGAIPIRVTPTLIIVDSRGVVERVLEGGQTDLRSISNTAKLLGQQLQQQSSCKTFEEGLLGEKHVAFEKQDPSTQTDHFLLATRDINSRLTVMVARLQIVKSRREFEELNSWSASHLNLCIGEFAEAKSIARASGILKKRVIRVDLQRELDIEDRLFSQLLKLGSQWDPIPDFPRD